MYVIIENTIFLLWVLDLHFFSYVEEKRKKNTTFAINNYIALFLSLRAICTTEEEVGKKAQASQCLSIFGHKDRTTHSRGL